MPIILPVTPTIPSTVNPGDDITASYTNQQRQCFEDIWTDLQAAAAAITNWPSDVNAQRHRLDGVAAVTFAGATGPIDLALYRRVVGASTVLDLKNASTGAPTDIYASGLATENASAVIKSAINTHGVYLASDGNILFSPTVSAIDTSDVRITRWGGSPPGLGITPGVMLYSTAGTGNFIDTLRTEDGTGPFTVTRAGNVISTADFRMSAGEAVLGTSGVVCAASKSLAWSSGAHWYDGVDVQLLRFNTGQLKIHSPTSASDGDLIARRVYADELFRGAVGGYGVLIDSAGTFVGAGVSTSGSVNAGISGVHTPGDIVSQANIGANGPASSYYCNGLMVINSAGGFVGVGINTAGAIILRGNTLFVQNAAGSQTNASIDTNGNVAASTVAVQNYFVAQGSPGLSGAYATGAGQTLHFAGGILVAVT
jgi:hypothetical protein